MWRGGTSRGPIPATASPASPGQSYQRIFPWFERSFECWQKKEPSGTVAFPWPCYSFRISILVGSPSEKPHLSQLPRSTPAPGLTSFLCCPDSQPTRIFQTVCALVFQEVRKNTTLLSDGATGCISPLDSK